VDPSGAPVVAAAQLLAALDGQVRLDSGWAEVVVARQPFRFLVGAPLYVFSNQLRPMAAPASRSSLPATAAPMAAPSAVPAAMARLRFSA
jgi:hypothetical protein